MPYKDGTGPLGQGPRTGRQAGNCPGAQTISPGQDLGRGRGRKAGFGQGLGQNRGLGRGRNLPN